jgi:hypothetical protein
MAKILDWLRLSDCVDMNVLGSFVPGTLAFWGAVDTSTVDTSTQVDISCPVFG